MKRMSGSMAVAGGERNGRAARLASLLVALTALAPAAFAELEAVSAKPEAESEASEPHPDSWSVQTRVTTEFGVISTRFWSKGALFRADTLIAGHPVTTIVDTTHYYVYDEMIGKGAAIERNAQAIAEDATRGRPFGREYEQLIATGGELVPDEDLEALNLSFEVYQRTNEIGKRRVFVTSTEPRLPARVETFVRSSGKRGVLEYTNWQRAMAMNDSFFVPPNTVEFERVSYEEYTRRAGVEPVGPAPVYYRDLLHGVRQPDA